MRTFVTITAFVVVSLLGVYHSANAAPDGQALYISKCKVCHGEDGKGNPKLAKMAGIDLTSAKTQKKSDKALFDIVRKGVKNDDGKTTMTASSWSDDEIKAVISHVRTLKN